jgi:hypothetical protein
MAMSHELCIPFHGVVSSLWISQELIGESIFQISNIYNLGSRFEYNSDVVGSGIEGNFQIIPRSSSSAATATITLQLLWQKEVMISLTPKFEKNMSTSVDIYAVTHKIKSEMLLSHKNQAINTKQLSQLSQELI